MLLIGRLDDIPLPAPGTSGEHLRRHDAKNKQRRSYFIQEERFPRVEADSDHQCPPASHTTNTRLTGRR